MLLDAGYAGLDDRSDAGRLSPRGRAGMETREMLRPLAEWPTQAWPHLLWLAPGEVLALMRVAFLSVSSELGGSETSLLLLVQNIRQLQPEWR